MRLCSGSGSWCYDANGNPGYYNGEGQYGTLYDVENRAINNVGVAYDPSGKRVVQGNGNIGATVYFYGIDGKRLGTYSLPSGATTFSTASLSLYFGGKLMRSGGLTTATDRLGSVRATLNGAYGPQEQMTYWPYGQERTSTPDGREKFATYYRFSGGGDYADQRYYATGYGRFQTPDPIGKNAVDPKNPTSWNMYAYANDDSVNFNDPTGRLPCDGSGVGGNDGGSGCGGYPEWWCNGTATAFNPLPDPTCVYSGPETSWSGAGLSDPPCWKDLGLVGETLTDLGKNVEEIAATKITNAGELTALDSEIDSEADAEFNYLVAQIAPASANQPGKTYFNGGHFNLILQTPNISGILGGDFSTFQSLFGGGLIGSHNDAIWGDAAKGDFTLHSHQNNNTFNFHFDLYNPLDVPVGSIGHLIGDVIGGHIGGRCLDPAWRYQ